MTVAERIQALRDAAKLFEQAADIMSAAQTEDPLDYGEECVNRAFDELDDVCYDVGFLVGLR